MLGDFSCRVLLNVFGFVFPAYHCFKSVEARDQEGLRGWCIYWLILAIFTTTERMLLDMFIFWVPLYYEAKFLFVLYLWHPRTKGALYLYDQAVKPFLQKHEAFIDGKLEESFAQLGDYSSHYIRRLIAFVQSKAHIAIAQLQQMQSKDGPGGLNRSFSWQHMPSPQTAANVMSSLFSSPSAGKKSGLSKVEDEPAQQQDQDHIKAHQPASRNLDTANGSAHSPDRRPAAGTGTSSPQPSRPTSGGVSRRNLNVNGTASPGESSSRMQPTAGVRPGPNRRD